jgi:outer membrane protein assembly factor BamB
MSAISRSLLKVIILLILLVPLLTNDVTAENWEMFLKSPQHVSVCSEKIPDEIAIIWDFELENCESYSSPIVVDSRVYLGAGAPFGAEDRYDVLYCIDANDGTELWSFRCAEETLGNYGICSTPCVYDNKIYFGTSDFHAYCLDATTGDEIWKLYLIEETHPEPAHGACSSPVVYENKVYFATDSYEDENDINQNAPNLFCLDTEGNNDGTTDIIWSYASPNDGQFYSSPAIKDDKLIIGSCSSPGEVICLDTDGNGDGTTNQYWYYQLPAPIMSSPSIDDNTVYIGDGIYTSNQPTFNTYAIDLDSQGELGPLSEDWHYTSTAQFQSTPTPYENFVYIGDLDGTVHCIDTNVGIGKTASSEWTYDTGSEIWGTPTIATDKLVVGNFNGDLYCLETEGSGGTTIEVWSIHLSDAEIYASAALVDDRIYISSRDGRLFCLGESGGSSGNIEPTFSESRVSPSTGDNTDEFTFSIIYTDLDDEEPVYIQVNIDGDYFDMMNIIEGSQEYYDNDYTNGEKYFYKTKLPAGVIDYYFEAYDGYSMAKSETSTIMIEESPGTNNDEDGKGDEGIDTGEDDVLLDNSLVCIGAVIIIIIIILALILLIKKQKNN